MTRIARAGLIVVATLAALAIGAALFVGTGVYNIGADDHHTRIVLTMIEQLRNRSIAVRASGIAVPNLEDPRSIETGAAHYARLCAGCHLAPGVTKSDIRAGLYPHPPNLAQEDVDDAQEAFWIIKHGIKMSAMPAWGKTLGDDAIWEIVSFVRHMPAMSAETYQQLSTARAQ
jgi:mono/diheme cytochrome c family protein